MTKVNHGSAAILARQIYRQLQFAGLVHAIYSTTEKTLRLETLIVFRAVSNGKVAFEDGLKLVHRMSRETFDTIFFIDHQSLQA